MQTDLKTYLCSDCEVEWTLPADDKEAEPCDLCGKDCQEGSLRSIYQRGHLTDPIYDGQYNRHYEAGDDDQG